MRAAHVLLLATVSGAVGAQPALIESGFGRGQFGANAVAVEVAKLAGDARDDLLLRRTATDGDFAELWVRDDAGPGGYSLGQPLPAAALRGQVVTDIDFDGDADIVLATADPSDSVVLWINDTSTVPSRFVRSPQRHAVPGIVSAAGSYFADNAAAPPLRAGVLLARSGAPNVALRYDGTGGLTALPTDYPHAGGASVMVSLVGDAAGRGLDHMSLGAPPQRLWLSSNTSFAYTERVVDEITSTVVAALCTDLDRDGDSELVLATAARTVEIWDNQAGEFTLRQSIAVPQAASLEAISLLDIDAAPAPAHADIVVSYTTNAATPARRSTLYRYDAPSGQFVARGDELPHAAALAGAGAGGSARLYLGERGIGVRILQPRTAPLDPVTLQFDAPRAYALAALPTGLMVRTSLPSPVFVTASAPPASGFIHPGMTTGLLDVPTSVTRTTGRYTFTLAAPTSAQVTLGALTSIDLYVFQSFDQTICAIECLMSGQCPMPPAAAGAAKATSPYMGTAAETQTLRDFRDLVLRDSPKGDEYEALYDRFEGELYTVTLSSPSFYLDLAAAKNAWMPAIESLVAGSGDAPITPAMADAMDAVFDHFRSNGSRALREAVEREYARLDPRAHVGQSIDALRDAWEALPPDAVFASGFEDG